eukprot:s604_g14.t1
MIALDPGDVPCYMLLKGMQIPRVIGKAGAIIKELRQESGANVNILDKQLPEVLQRLQFHVAFVKGSHEAMHAAVVGLVRNARAPQALRALEPTEVGDTDVAFLVPALCEPYLGEEQLTSETRCVIHVEVMEGLQKHRKVLLRAEETHDLQIVAWRLQELQIRMSQAALLVDRDFDLQDSAWAGAMEAFRAKRAPDGVQAASQQAAVPLERLPTLPSASEGIEQEARKSREAQQREVEAEKERERKRQIRETTAREQQECQNAAREAKMLADKARDMRLRAMEATSADQHQSCIREAERYEEQARQARARSTRGYGTGPRAQQHEYQEDESCVAAAPKVAEDAEAQAMRRRHEEREELRRESELRGQQAKENEAREREVLQRAVSSLAQGGGHMPHRSQGPVASPSTAEDRQARQSEILANSARAAPARALEEASLRPASAGPPVATSGGGCLHGRPEPQGALSREMQDVALFVCIPDKKAAEFLVSSKLGIGRRSGAKVSVADMTGSGPTLLECRGTPLANAIASYLVQEALWMRTRDDGVRRDMELLEEKLMRQILRLQEQSERFMDIMMHPLEAKVAAMEGRQPVTDCSIAELRGNLRGLQESLEMQVRRAEQTETRLSKWRKSVEEDLQQKQEEMKRKFSEAVSNSDVVSRNELLELAKLLKQELRKVVDETLKDEKLATQQDLATATASMRRELASVEKIAAGAAAQKALGQQELANAAEAVRAEMKTLTERAVAEEALTMEKFAALDAVEKEDFPMALSLALLLPLFTAATEISILPDARLVASDSEPLVTGTRAEVIPKVELVQAHAAPPVELPETVEDSRGFGCEDVEARWLGIALSHMGWVLSESPLSLGQKTTSYLLDAEKDLTQAVSQEEHERSPHQTMALSVLSMLGVSVGRQHRAHSNPSSIPTHSHQMFGGIPWLLIIPIVLGMALASIIQVVSLYSEWADAKDKLSRGEPLEPELVY